MTVVVRNVKFVFFSSIKQWKNSKKALWIKILLNHKEFIMEVFLTWIKNYIEGDLQYKILSHLCALFYAFLSDMWVLLLPENK